MVKHSDHILFGALKEGSDVAFKKVYRENRSLFLNFAKKYGLNTEDVLDIYQDAYIVFYENVSKGKLKELKSSLSTYLISIGKYMMLDRLRKNKKEALGNNFMEQMPEWDNELEAFDVVQRELSTEQQLLRKNFELLGEKCRKVLTLFYYRKYSIKQIMTEGNYNSENVVKSQKSRCLKTLKEAIKNSSVG
ncbi:RNA polymerase sigma factor [Spongiimicrobium salis]|uniref:RNA polymerase sigma factor n=1 Tax=Spongiimicrobium salis TaxID=1667022 RepID=UPI00374D1AA8